MAEETEKSATLNLDRSTFSLRAVKGPKDEEPTALEGAGDSGESSADYTAYMFELSCPILFSADLVHVIEGPDFRIFPPVQLDRGHGPSIPAKNVYIPCGSRVVNWARWVDYSSCLGFVYSINQTKKIPVFRGYGLRVDTTGGSVRAIEMALLHKSG